MRSRKKVGQFSTLGLVNDDIAQGYMTHIMQRLELLLESRDWYIHHLKEFYPRSLRLLGLNVQKGKEVCIRFRVPSCKSKFLPFSEVMCTVLHELVHCVHSRHDKSFWEMYGRLVAECEALEVQLLEKGFPLYPNHIGLENAFLSCTEESADGFKRNRKRQDVAGSASLVEGSKRRHIENSLQNSDCSSFRLSGHRLGGGVTDLPTSEEDRRALFAAKARQRHQKHLLQWCRNEKEGELCALGALRNPLYSDQCEESQENRNGKHFERYFVCGCPSSENSCPENLLSCELYADGERDIFNTDLEICNEENGVMWARSLHSHSDAFSNSWGTLPTPPRSSFEESFSLDVQLYESLGKKEQEDKAKNSEEEPLPRICDDHRVGKVKTTSIACTDTRTEKKRCQMESFPLQRSDTGWSPSKPVNCKSFAKDKRSVVVEIVSDEDGEDTAGYLDSMPLIIED